MTWDYIAGFFDGEGSLTEFGNGYRISLPQTHFGVLKEIKDFVGVGHVMEVTKRQPHWKDAWVYYIAKQEDVFLFCRNIHGKLVVKRDQMDRVLTKIEANANILRQKKEVSLRRLWQADCLRRHGLTYRQVGPVVGWDWSYVRRALIKAKLTVAIAQQ